MRWIKWVIFKPDLTMDPNIQSLHSTCERHLKKILKDQGKKEVKAE